MVGGTVAEMPALFQSASSGGQPAAKPATNCTTLTAQLKSCPSQFLIRKCAGRMTHALPREGLCFGDLRRSSRGLGCMPFGSGRRRVRSRVAGADLLAAGRDRPGLRMRPLRNGHGMAAIVMAAAGASNCQLVRDSCFGIVAMMSLADTTGMRGGGSSRQGQRDKRPDQRHQQQQYGSAPLHGLPAEQNPRLRSA